MSSPAFDDVRVARTGLELVKGVMAGALPSAPMADLLTMRDGGAGDGWLAFRGTPIRRHGDPLGAAHGGDVATRLDGGIGRAGPTPAGIGCATVDLSITCLRPMTDATGAALVRGEGAGRVRRTAATTYPILSMDKAA